MLYQVSQQICHILSKQHKYMLILLTIVLICGCNQRRGEGFVKLDAPLRNVLSKIILVVPDQVNEKGEPIEITVGNAYSGKGEYYIGDNQTHEFQYTFHNKHVVEGNKNIYAVVSYNWGGSGTFYYLTAVNKTTLKGDKVLFLGDRVEIKKLSMSKRPMGFVSINYMGRESGTSMSEKPDKLITHDITFHQGKLTTIKVIKFK
ncbi:MAG: hypothetical protein OXD54_07195 [Candidatus Poribacteria bacterium]|nr:hypothetical protein [Candidatus Poribacteria bacterium]